MTSRLLHSLSAAILATLAFSATAADYYVVVPVLGKRAPSAPAPVIAVALATAALPAGMVGTSYPPFDLKPSLSVTGDGNFDAAQVAWGVTSGALPAGLHLDAGVVSGTPEAQTAGADFTVQATYKTKSGQQAYTIVVNGATLQVSVISSGLSHTCAVTTDGGVKCWGLNNYGQLGDGTIINKASPVSVTGLVGVARISVGFQHSCAVTAIGGVKCWGNNANNQLGDGTVSRRTTPVAVTDLASGVASVSSGGAHTCAVTTSGGVMCWGLNGSGQLGDGTLVQKSKPVAVTGLASGVVSISGGSDHTCAITTNGGAKCWGYNDSGQLGDGTVTNKATPVAVNGLLSGAVSISAGSSHTCAITPAGGALCWGSNGTGQLGDGTLVQKLTPVAVIGLASGVKSISGLITHSCAITINGGVKCWGYNGVGQLGDGTLSLRTTPVDVLGLSSGVSGISAGNSHTCAVATSGLKCWGRDNFGQLGNDTALTDKPTPVDVLP